MSERRKVRKNPSPIRKRRRPHRHIRSVFLVLLVAAALLIGAVLIVPPAITTGKLKKLGYSQEGAESIRKQNLTDTILNSGFYSEYLEKSIEDHSVRLNYLRLYTYRTSDHPLTDLDFLIYGRLVDRGYLSTNSDGSPDTEQIEDLYTNLTTNEMIPLLVFDYQWDERDYVADCLASRSANTSTSFTLEGNYLTPYKITAEVYDPEDLSVLVNSRYHLPADFTPSDLVTLSSENAVNGLQLRKEAAEEFTKMSQASIAAGHPFFASGAYQSAADTEAVRNTCAMQVGSAYADTACTRSGFNERETGLSVTVAPTYEEYENFHDTEVYKWLEEHAADYGFIERYPASRAECTGESQIQNQYRYVGKDLAQAVKESGLSYDEYWALYLKPWESESSRPKDDILESTGSTDAVSSEKTDEK
jgi:LAS superfamily LD-carboxypeptidase LdcB